MKVALATRNSGKVAELKALLRPLPFTLCSQADFDIPSPPETGLSFVENALIKARAVAAAAELAAIADDSGLVVPVLNGAPGIYSARYAGEGASDASNNAKLLAELARYRRRGAPIPAYFYCAMVGLRHAGDPTPIIATAAWHGIILHAPRGSGGFGYDPLFFVPELGLTSAELDPQVKNQLSHRGQATRCLLEHLTAWHNA